MKTIPDLQPTFEKIMNAALHDMVRKHSEEVLEIAKKDLERRVSESITIVASEIQRHFVVNCREERIVIEIRNRVEK